MAKDETKTKTIDFTIRNIEAIKPPPKGADRLEFKDAKQPGLYLRVTSGGIKSFSFVGRAKGAARPERETIGRFPAVKPEQARTQARQLLGQLSAGTSVAAARREKKGGMTVEELWGHYSKHRVALDKKMETSTHTWEAYVKPVWGKRLLSDISGLDVERWHHALPAKLMAGRAERAAKARAREEARRRAVAERQAIRRRGPDPKPLPPAVANTVSRFTGQTAANRALELLRAMLNHALEEKRQYLVGTNPASGHEKYVERPRRRFLQPDELRPFFEALASEPNETMRDFFVVALLTGARRANVLAMRWADVSLVRAEWHLVTTKNGDPQTVTLSPEAVQILRRRFDEKGSSAYVFPSERSAAAKDGRDDHLREPKAAWKRILQRAELADLRIHDLRRSLGSWQANTGASLVLIGKSLNHKDPQSTAIYAQLNLDPVRASVDRATAAMFQAGGMNSPPPADVIPFPQPKANLKLAGK